ncbi:MAG TPA: Dickkopf N-terminal cysteine-rich domain-containing protein [Polyangiaceae bacterium]
MLQAKCSWMFKCCSVGELALELGAATSDNCADLLIQSATQSFARVANDPDVSELLNAFNYAQYGFPGIKVDPMAVATCASSIAAKDCTAAPPVDHCAPTAPAADGPCSLDKLLPGSLAAGGDCTAFGPNPCASGLVCRSVAAEAGVCVPVTKVGDLCLSDSDCGSHLVCEWSSGTCATGAGYGEACAFTDADNPVPGTETKRCAIGLACDTVALTCTDPNCAAGKNCLTDAECPKGIACVADFCQPLRQPGQNCFQTSDCASGACSYDPVANRSLCTAPKADGAACVQPSDCASGYCAFDVSSSTQVCMAALANGDMCTLPDQCKSGNCTNGMCLAVAAGATCTTDADCAVTHNLFCADGACTLTPFALGTSCSANSQCDSANCLAGKCAEKAAIGDDCDANTPCDDTSYCNIAASKTLGTCTALKAQGDPCTRDIECASGCQATNGALRCNGQPRGVAVCGGA